MSSSVILEPELLTARAHGLERPHFLRSCTRSTESTPNIDSRLKSASSVEAWLNADSKPATEAGGLADRRGSGKAEAGGACAVCLRRQVSLQRLETRGEATLDVVDHVQDRREVWRGGRSRKSSVASEERCMGLREAAVAAEELRELCLRSQKLLLLKLLPGNAFTQLLLGRRGVRQEARRCR